MLGYNTPPFTGSHTGNRGDGLDGATPNLGTGSPAQHAGNSSHYTSPYANNNTYKYNSAHLYPSRPQLRSPEYMRLLPDWDSRNVVPKPRQSLILRLQSAQNLPDSAFDMKAVSNVHKYYTNTYSGLHTESWAEHLDELEAEFFERENFKRKQCYFVIRSTLRSAALTTLQ